MKKKNTLSLVLLALLFIITPFLYAVPAIPHPVTFTQPNGDTLTVKIKGDERMNWHESMDGYTLLFNQAGYLSYAQLDMNGNLQPSDMIATNIEERNIVTRSFLNNIEKGLFYSDVQRQLMLKIWEIEDNVPPKSDRAVIGHYKTLCAFVQFPEKAMIRTMDEFDGLLNQLGYTTNGTGSVRDYFKESSYDLFDLTITLCGIYTAPNSSSYYAGSSGTSSNCRALATWLAQQVAAEPDINFIDYDSDNDGYVDGFHFIFAGRGREAGGGSGTIWSHKWNTSSTVIQNGKRISVYSCSPELLYSDITTIGVICHEMTHAFGAPDFYDTNGTTGGEYLGTGNWDLMASGSWNGAPGGNRPPHHNIYTKIKFGWVTPTVLNSAVTIPNMPNSAENPVAYRINTTTNNEYFLLENRQQRKFDTSIPGSGLIIYRVHSSITSYENNNTINTTHPQRMYPVCASSTVALPTAGPANYGNINSAGCPFPGNSNQTSFTDDTTPAMKSWANNNTNKPITNIIQTNGLIRFDFMGGGQVPTYTITASAEDNGTITPSGNITVNEGESQTFTFAPQQGFCIDQVLIDGENNPEAVENGYYTFTNVTDDHTIVVIFTLCTYTVNFDANGGTGTMEPQEFTYGEAQNLTANAFTGTEYNVFTEWNTQADGNGTRYNDEQNITIAENMTLFAQWVMPSYTITATAEGDGEITPEGEIVVLAGESQTFTITPHIILKGDECCAIIDVLVDGISIGDFSPYGFDYVFENVNDNHTIHVIFSNVGIVETDNYPSLRIAPNPANDFVELQITNYELRINQIEFYNAFGQLVKTVPYHGENKDDIIIQRISIANLNKGVYLIKAGNEAVKLVVH
ncbi:MAG: M6 family metalloprotease domain-containing protein [Lentimicrobiaceae bacterium]|nr:M6 family metalloprotease domain-containing protein [Lentimicrobiaceae bacterium]